MRTRRSANLAVLLLLLAVLRPAGLDAQAQRIQYRTIELYERLSLPTTQAVTDAEARVAANPGDPALLIELARAQAGVRDMRSAIETLSRGISRWPENAQLYRWRGHRYLSVREFDRAVADFDRGLALDSAVYGIWYHLGVIHFVRGDFNAAVSAFERARPLAPDSAEAAGASDWLWMSLIRANRFPEAGAVLSRLPAFVGVDNAYTRRLKLYVGDVTPENFITEADTADVQLSTLAFGVGNWLIAQGDTAAAEEWMLRAVGTTGWPAFGFMAAEAELRALAVNDLASTGWWMFPEPPAMGRADAPRLACLAAIPDSLMRGVMVNATVIPLDGAPSRAAALGAAQAVALFLHRVVEDLHQRASASSPYVEASFTWLDVAGGALRATATPTGLRWELVGAEPDHPARTAAGLQFLSRAMRATLDAHPSAFAWPDAYGADSVVLRISLSLPLVTATRVEDSSVATIRIPAFAIQAPIIRQADIKEMGFLERPRAAHATRNDVRFLLEFMMDTSGRVARPSVRATALPRPDGQVTREDERITDQWFIAARDLITRTTFTPPDIGGCREPFLARMPITLRYRR